MGGRGAKHSRRSRAYAYVTGLLASLSLLALSACGGGPERQDADEPEGKYPVEVTTAKFPNRQRLAQTSNLRLGVKNVGDQAVPNAVITIFVDPDADLPFNVRTDQPTAANPNRPVWVLENGFPKLIGSQAPAGAQSAQQNTFQFGPLPPGETVEAVWRLSPVRPGTWTVNYRVGAGLTGKAEAVTEDGSPPTGKFLVRITQRPPVAGVSDSGEVTIKER